MTNALYALATVTAVVAAVLRITQWRNRPRTRTFTLALVAFAAFACTRITPVSDAIDERIGTNIDNLLADSLLIFASYALLVHCARAWDRTRYVPALITAGVITVIAQGAAFFASDAPHESTYYVGSLGGWAVVYALIGGITVMVTNLVVFALVTITPRVALADCLAMSALNTAAAFGVVAGANRALHHTLPSIHDVVYYALARPLTALMVLLYAIYALVGYAFKRKETQTELAHR